MYIFYELKLISIAFCGPDLTEYDLFDIIL